MARLDDVLGPVSGEDHLFVGTIAFRNEQLTLPDGSTIALGIDDAHWVLIYQKEKKAPFVVYDYDENTKLFRVRQKERERKGNGGDEKADQIFLRARADRGPGHDHAAKGRI